jgi:hypothetical protein
MILICSGKTLTEDFNMFWKTRIFDDSLTANGNKLRTYRNLKEKYETDTYLFSIIGLLLLIFICVNCFIKLRIERRHKSIGVFVVYIDIGSSMQIHRNHVT